jgi:uncharacterized membrane protein YsdA (DUF1294 family)
LLAIVVFRHKTAKPSSKPKCSCSMTETL